MDHWVTYWSGPTAMAENGKLIDHIASEQLVAAGVEPGDRVFVISYYQGRLHVVTSLVVEQVTTTKKAEKILGRTDLWDATWHIIARADSVRTATMARMLSDGEVASLRFISKDGRVAPPARNKDGGVDPQTFRTTRRVTLSTAATLAAALDADK